MLASSTDVMRPSIGRGLVAELRIRTHFIR